MTTHTITITLDVAPGLESAVSDAVYIAIEKLNEARDRRSGHFSAASNLLNFVSPAKGRPKAVEDVMQRLAEESGRVYEAHKVVTNALSEIQHAMSEADSAWRRQQ